MSGPRFPSEVILYRGPEDVFRIGAVEGSEHALGFLKSPVDVQKTEEGSWVFVDDNGDVYPTTADLPDSRWEVLIPHYPLPLAKQIMQNAVRRHVGSALIFRLVLRGVRDASSWKLQLMDDGLMLVDGEGEVQASSQAEDWWFVKSQERAQELADALVGATGLRPLNPETLVARISERSDT